MSKILAALERNHHTGSPDHVIDSFTASLGKAAADLELAKNDIKNLNAQLATVKGERDRYLVQVQGFASTNTEIGQLREKNQGLEAGMKQKNAAILLEQSTLKKVSGDANDNFVASNQKIDLLVGELSTEKARNAELSGALSAMKSRPAVAPVQKIIPSPPVDYSGMEFSIGNIVRGPDGIQNAQIKLVKAN